MATTSRRIPPIPVAAPWKGSTAEGWSRGARARGAGAGGDPADSGRRALEGLDRGGVVVALDLERDRLALAEVDDAGVLPRPLEDVRGRGGEAAEEPRRVLVRAVL